MTDKVKLWILAGTKGICIIAVIVFIANLMSSGRISQVELSAVEEAVTAECDMSNVQAGSDQMIRRLYGLDPDEYEGTALYYPVSTMGAEELLIVKLSDLSQQETVAEAMEKRISTQKNSFEGYGVEQTEMLEKGVIQTDGNYMMMIVSADPSGAVKAFEAAVKGK